MKLGDIDKKQLDLRGIGGGVNGEYDENVLFEIVK